MALFGKAQLPGLLIGAGFGLCVGVLISLGYAYFGRAGLNILPASLVERINAETDSLLVQLRDVELPSEKAKKAREAIKRGDYSAAHQLVAGVLVGSHLENWRYYPFGDFIHGIADVSDPSFGTQLDAWVAQSKADPIPLLVRAQYYYQVGWFKRGHHFASATQTPDLASFQDDMNLALADIDTAIKLSDNPYSSYLELQILRGLGLSAQMKSAFERAIGKYPAYYQLYNVMLGTLEPKWRGTVPAMYAFVDQYVGNADKNSPLKLLYVSLYRDLLDTASVACSGYGNNKDARSRCVDVVMQKIVRSDLENEVVAALALYDGSDRYEFGLAVDDILSDMLRTTGGDKYAGAFLEMAATAMHSDTQLKEDKPGHNDYIIDMAVSQSWYLKGFYENSLKKNREALRDAQGAVFPNKEAKSVALAGIYEYLADNYDQLHQYREMIVFEQAAIVLGGKTAYEHLVCYGYYRLKAYDDAVRTCTQAIKDEPDNMRAYYWRGLAYRDSGRADAALADLTKVADSENNFRASAAIDISMIYFDRKDVQGALRVLNKYTYLYNPVATNRDDIAVSYNNRCYAYMQLGELQEALDDCRASLKFGNLPDAYRKQQELVQRIGAGQKGL